MKSIAEITQEEQHEFVFMMNRYGATVLVQEEFDDGLQAYKTLDRWFGRCIPHDAMNEFGIVEINPAKPTSINTANPKKEHLPHTDDAYTDSPSALLGDSQVIFHSLRCLKSSVPQQYV